MPDRGTDTNLFATFYAEPGGPVVDPLTVELTITLNGDTIEGPIEPPELIHDAVGLYRYVWSIPIDAELGTYVAQWTALLPDEDEEAVGYEEVAVTDGLDSSDEGDCWPVDTSCVHDWNDWAVAPDVEGPVIGVPLYTAEEKARAVALAGMTMRLLTGFRVGGCPVTVRPCSRACAEHTYRDYPLTGGGGVPWAPYVIGGTWVNIGCACSGSCGCSVVREVSLGMPASQVSEVLLDGEVLSPAAYRLDRGGKLVRLDGEGWPVCQNLNEPTTEPGTWAVTYVPGHEVDSLGAFAAGLLAGQYVRACSGGECDLPDNVTQLVRQGVTMQLMPGLFPEGTGIREVDVYVQRWNPGKLRGPARVYSPDIRSPR